MNLKSIFLIMTVSMATSACSQEEKLRAEYRTAAIEKIVMLVKQHYVFPEVGNETARVLEQQAKVGVFDTVANVSAFAGQLTRVVQSVNHDKHMRIRVQTARGQSQPSVPVSGVDGFSTSAILENNIGYLDVGGFFPPAIAKKAADDHMRKLVDADAIIIDLRKNGGGSPETVQYLCSYFFDKRVHLNSLYFRGTDQTTDFWTVDVSGKKMPEVPLFILTSANTFSGAEEFCYNMQTRKRATLVGETTGGGANPGDVFMINDDLSIFIPTGRAINPVTKTNWEGTGVIPDVKIAADQAYDKAVLLARKALGY